jgi:hypothetical protein
VKEYLEELIESATLLDLKKKMGGNPGTSESLKIGEKFVKEISLMRELDIEIVHFDYLIDAASNLVPPNQIVARELKKAKEGMVKARTQLQKNVNTLSVVDVDKKLVKRK